MSTAAQPERDELAPVTVAAEHDVVVGAREPGVLHPDVVLVRVEVGDPLVRLSPAEHVRGRGTTLPLGVVPVLES